MRYDLFIQDESLAEQIVEMSGRVYLIDRTAEPDVYQFFDLSESEMYGLRRLVYANPKKVEIRGSAKGEMIWPSDSGTNLEQALDILC